MLSIFISVLLVFNYRVARNMNIAEKQLVLYAISQSCAFSGDIAPVYRPATSMSTRSVMLWLTVFVSLCVRPLDATRAGSPSPGLELLPQRSRLAFGMGPGRGPGADVHEVGLEVTRTSQTYRRRLQQALANLLLWVALTRWTRTEWWIDVVVTNQILCEYIEHLHSSSSGKLSEARHAVLAVQTAFR